jgi:hypothetical protein
MKKPSPTDTNKNWQGHMADLKTLLDCWERQRAAGKARHKRTREILTMCFFALCLENNENKRFLVGFQRRGRAGKAGPVEQLFDPKFGEDDDSDAFLVEDPGPDISVEVEKDIHRCQIVGYLERPEPSTEDLISFLEEKKLRRVARNDDLRLIVHLEQPIAFDWVKLSAHLQMRAPKCPFSQVFLVAQISLVPTNPIL